MKSALLKWTMAVGMATSAFGLTYAAQPTQMDEAYAATTMYSQVDNLNIRTGPSTKYRSIGQFDTNDKIKVLKSYNSSWYQISYKGNKRYVYKYWVSKNVFVLTTGTVVTPKGVNLNIRSGPGTGYRIVTKAASGAKVKVTSFHNGKWFKVYHNGHFGYASSDYLKVKYE